MTVLGGKKPLHTKYELSYATLDSCSEIQFPGMANVSGLLREYGEGGGKFPRFGSDGRFGNGLWFIRPKC